MDREGHVSVKKTQLNVPTSVLESFDRDKSPIKDLVDEEPVAYVLHAKVTESAEHSGPGVQMARNGQRVLLSPTGKTLIYRTPSYTECKGTVTLQEKMGKKRGEKKAIPEQVTY